MKISAFLKLFVLSVFFVSGVFTVSDIRFSSLKSAAGLTSSSVIISEDPGGQTGTIWYLNDRYAPRPLILKQVLKGKKSIEIGVTPDEEFVWHKYRVVNSDK
ncbi:MAG: hypothetical protein WCF94_01655 [bacterium]